MPPPLAARLVEPARPRWYRDETLALEVEVGRRMLARRTDVVHMLYGDEQLWWRGDVARLSRRRGPRLVCSFHQPPKVLDEVGPGPRRLRQLHGVVTLAGNQADHLAEIVGEDRVFRLTHGVDTVWWRPGDGPKADATCLFVGQWLRDVDVLVAVAARLAERAPEVRIRVAGASPEANAALAAAPNVTLLERLSDDDLREEYRAASLLLLPLADATTNCAMLEAMGCGTPIVVTDVGGTRSYVDDTNAVLTPHGDAEAMTEAVLELLGDDERRAALGAAARARALTIDWRRTAGRIAEMYRAVAA